MARKAPIRTCVACGATADKRELLRVVRSPEGSVAFDASGKKPGRGAYLCAEERCFARARAKRLLDARLRVKLSAGDYDRLKAEFDDLRADVRGSREGW